MVGRQINFYFTEEDYKELENYVLEKSILVLPNYSLDMEKEIILSDKNYSMKLLTLPILKDQIVKRYIDTQNYFTCDIWDSPVIELHVPKHDTHLMRRGRVYYTKENQTESKSKETLFLEFADDLFKWMRKNYKNTKLKGFENFLITERTKNWLLSSSHHILADMKTGKSTKQKVA
jgi:hypothetical protein